MVAEEWEKELALCEFSVGDTERILRGIKFGVDIEFVGDRALPRYGRNLRIDPDHAPKVAAVIAADVAAGKKAGPLDAEPCPFFVVSPIGAVPKKDPGKIRVIHHLSYPFGGDSVNADVLEEGFDLARFADAVKAVVQLGRGCFLIKLDVEAAYKQVPVRREDWPLLGFMWEGKYYYERVLPFGLKSSCRIWDWYAAALHRMFQRMGIEHVIHYIDDFLFVVRSREEGDRALAEALALCIRLGVPMAPSKVEGPSTCLTFLGIELDTIAMESRLPQSKLDEIKRLTSDWARKDAATMKELQSIAGLLSFASSVVRPGRFFIRSFFTLAAAMKAKGVPAYKAWKVSAQCRADLAWWRDFVPRWNGKSMLYERQWTDAPTIQFFSDACLSGFGAWFGRQWIERRWSAEELLLAQRAERVSMPFLELFGVVTAALTWGPLWRGKKITFRCDCQPAVFALQKGASPDPGMMHLLRVIALDACLRGYDFRCEHIEGVRNAIADELSRNGASPKFRLLHPSGLRDPTPIVEPPSPPPRE